MPKIKNSDLAAQEARRLEESGRAGVESRINVRPLRRRFSNVTDVYNGQAFLADIAAYTKPNTNDMQIVTVGARMKYLRLLHGLSLENIASHTNITRQNLSLYENGDTKLVGWYMMDWCDGTRISPYVFVGCVTFFSISRVLIPHILTVADIELLIKNRAKVKAGKMKEVGNAE